MEVFEVSDHPLWNCSLLVVVGGDQHFLGGSAQNIGVSTKIIYHPKMMVKSHRGQSTSIEGGHQLKKNSIGTRGQCSSQSAFRWSTGTRIVDCYFHFSFHLLFSVTTFSHRRSAQIKKLIQQKLTGADILDFAGGAELQAVSKEQVPLCRQAVIPSYFYSTWCLLDIWSRKLSRNWCSGYFCNMHEQGYAMEKHAKQLFKNHRKPRNQQNNSLLTLFCLTLLNERKKFLFSSKHCKHNHIFWTDKGTIFFLFLFTNKGGGWWESDILVENSATCSESSSRTTKCESQSRPKRIA